MKNKSPVRLFFFGHQKERREKLDGKEGDKQEASYAMKYPDKHERFPL
jgi:hypothetical protein